MTAAAPLAVITRARHGVRRAAVRRHLEAVAAGRSDRVALDLDEPGLDVAGVVEDVTAGRPPDDYGVQLLVVAFKNSRVADRVIERLSAKGVRDRVIAARITGALRIQEATPWLSPLLIARDTSVAHAAARALGRIGGSRSAAALLLAIQRKGMSRRLVSELARGAPDLFIEVALQDSHKPPVKPALAIAAGLRRRHTAIGPLLALVQEGSRRERVIACRALGWIGASTAIPVISEALADRDWKVKVSAAKALGALRADSARSDLEPLLVDRNPRVRKAAEQALRRLDRVVRWEIVLGA